MSEGLSHWNYRSEQILVEGSVVLVLVVLEAETSDLLHLITDGLAMIDRIYLECAELTPVCLWVLQPRNKSLRELRAL